MSGLNLIRSVNRHLGMKYFAFFFFFVGDHSILIVFGKPPKFFVDSENSFEEIREKVNHG